jgi:cytochrome c1
MPRYAKRFLTALIAALAWIGAMAAFWNERFRLASSSRSVRVFRGNAYGYWIVPVTFTGLILLSVLMITAFQNWPLLSPTPTPAAVSLQRPNGPDAATLMIRYGCAGCHVITGVPGARGQVGPSLAGFASRLYVGGAVANEPGNLVRWLVNPRAVDPRSAMPVTGISDDEARVVAAYLYRNP